MTFVYRTMRATTDGHTYEADINTYLTDPITGNAAILPKNAMVTHLICHSDGLLPPFIPIIMGIMTNVDMLIPVRQNMTTDGLNASDIVFSQNVFISLTEGTPITLQPKGSDLNSGTFSVMIEYLLWEDQQ